MEENKTAEEILLKYTSPMLHHYQGAIIAMEEYANFKLTQQQSANAELKKQNEELVELLKSFVNLDRSNQTEYHLLRIKAIQLLQPYETK